MNTIHLRRGTEQDFWIVKEIGAGTMKVPNYGLRFWLSGRDDDELWPYYFSDNWPDEEILKFIRSQQMWVEDKK